MFKPSNCPNRLQVNFLFLFNIYISLNGPMVFGQLHSIYIMTVNQSLSRKQQTKLQQYELNWYSYKKPGSPYVGVKFPSKMLIWV